MSGALSPGQRVTVRIGGRRAPAYLRAMGEFADSMAMVRFDTGEVVEVPITTLGAEDRWTSARVTE